MKSIQWSLRALVVLITVTGIACNKSNGNGAPPPQPRPSGPVPPPPGAGNPNTTLTPEQQAQAVAAAETEAAKRKEQEEQAKATAAAAAPAATTQGAAASAPAAATLPVVATPVASSASTIEVPRIMGYAKTSDLVLRNGTGKNARTNSQGQANYARTSDLVGVQDQKARVIETGVQNNPPNNYANTSDLRLSDSGAAGNLGPGWPQGYQPSSVPLSTGMVDPYGQAYTDAKNDSVMAVIVDKMNRMDAQLRADSEQLAMAMNKINLSIDRQVVALHLEFNFSDRQINEDFTGYFRDSNRTLQLQQLTNHSGERFQVQVTCVDQGSNCRIAVLTIDQMKDSQVCRRVYAVHRWMMDGVGDGHFTLSRENYAKSTQIYYQDKEIIRANKAGIKYEKPLVVENRGERAFLRLVGNTIHYNLMMNNEIPQEISRVPRLGFLGIRSWAVAYGPSFFEISMGKTKPGSGGLVVGTTRMWGPLTKPTIAGEVTQTLQFEGHYSEAQNDQYYDERFASSMNLVQLLDNDGRGDLTLVVLFRDSSNPIRVNFTGLRLQSLDSGQLQRAIP